MIPDQREAEKMMRHIKAHFDRAVLQYSKGDVQQLLDVELDCAGPLLNIILDGVDHLGGMCYGFEEGSSDRSIRFMTQKMGVQEDLAKLLYMVVRNGITHEGMPKLGIAFFVVVPYRRYESGKLFYVSQEDAYIHLNVIELAYLYLDTIETIRQHLAEHVKFIPPRRNVNKEVFDRARCAVSNNLHSLIDKVGEDQRNEAIRNGQIEVTSSSSAYNPDNNFHTLNLP